MILATGWVILADVRLAVLAALPACSSLAFTSGRLHGWVVAAIALGTSIWAIRRYPRDASDPSAWAPVGSTAVASLVAAGLALFGSHPWTEVALGAGLATTVQALLVPALKRLFKPRPWPSARFVSGSRSHVRQTLRRFAHLPPSIRAWARAKLRLDPLFRELAKHVPAEGRLLDAGCGFGLPAVWLSLLHKDLHVDAFDAHPKRVRIARYVLGDRANVRLADAGGWADTPTVRYRVVLCIDVLHHLVDPLPVLQAVASCLERDGTLLLRTTIRSGHGPERSSLWVERWMVRLRGQHTVRFYEEDEVKQLLKDVGLGAIAVHREPSGRAETLFIARR